MSAIEEETIAGLTVILAELQAMTPLEPAGTPKSPADHEAWMAQHKAILEYMRKAEMLARATLPAPIAMTLFAVNQRALELFNAIPERSKESEGHDHAQ